MKNTFASTPCPTAHRHDALHTPTMNPAHYTPALSASDITLKQVRGFLAASQCSTFRQAAALVFLSHAAFAHAIQELESSLGEELFVRTSQGNQLSDAGKVFLPHAQRLMDCYSAALASLVKWRAGPSYFVLAGSRLVMPTVLPTLLSRTCANVDLPALRFEEANSQEVMASVLQGHADCGLCIVLTNHPDLHCLPLLESPLGLLTSTEFALPHAINTLADLNHIKLARYSDESVVSQLLQQHATQFDAYQTSRIVCDHMSAAFALVQSGQVAAITSGVGASHPQASGLRFTPLPHLLPSLTVSLVSKHSTAPNDRQTLMKDLTRTSVLQAPWHASVKLCSSKPAAPAA